MKKSFLLGMVLSLTALNVFADQTESERLVQENQKNQAIASNTQTIADHIVYIVPRSNLRAQVVYSSFIELELTSRNDIEDNINSINEEINYVIESEDQELLPLLRQTLVVLNDIQVVNEATDLFGVTETDERDQNMINNANNVCSDAAAIVRQAQFNALVAEIQTLEHSFEAENNLDWRRIELAEYYNEMIIFCDYYGHRKEAARAIVNILNRNGGHHQIEERVEVNRAMQEEIRRANRQ